jgi:hypothetical protein
MIVIMITIVTVPRMPLIILAKHPLISFNDISPMDVAMERSD